MFSQVRRFVVSVASNVAGRVVERGSRASYGARLGKRLASVVLIGLSMTTLLEVQANAQDANPKNQPVLQAQTDFNGVDIASRTYITASPLSFNAPGAGALNVRTVFNGRKLSYSLNMYLSDNTFTRWDTGDPSERHVKVHIGGVDRLFTCQSSGVCIQVGRKDGSSLSRISANKYVLKGKEGEIFSFFDLSYDPLPACTVDGCNAAGYAAYASVASVVYPSGEKLTFEPLTVVDGGLAVDTIRSNLGYKLTLSYHVSANYTPSSFAGVNWLGYRDGGQPETIFKLYNGASLIGTLNTQTVFTNQYRDAVLTQTDDLGRIYRVELHADPVAACGVDVDMTFLTPRVVQSPAGVRTDIAYGAYVPGETTPVSAVSRNGRTWTYGTSAGSSRSVNVPGVGNWEYKITGRTDGYDYGEQGPCPPGALVATVGEVTTPEQQTTKYHYDPENFASPNLVTNQEGDRFAYEYDGRGNLTKVTRLPKSGSSGIVIYEAGYSPDCENAVICNRPLWVKDAKGVLSGARTDYAYDAVHGGVLTETLPALPNGDRPQTRYTYSSLDTGDGVIFRVYQTSSCRTGTSCQAGAAERLVTNTYWQKTFLPASVVASSGDQSAQQPASFEYDLAGRKIRETNGLNQAVVIIYDAVGRAIGEIAPPTGGGAKPYRAKRTTYNGDDQITKVELGIAAGYAPADLASMTVLSTVDTTYDGGLKVREVASSATGVYSLVQFSYDAAERLECTAKRMNVALFNVAPSSACTPTSGGAVADRITKLGYDGANQVTATTSGHGVDPILDRRTTYTPNGRVNTETDGEGNVTTYTYDGFDRLSQVTYPNASKGSGAANSADYDEYGYDNNGNRTSWRRRDGGTITTTYDALNRPSSKTTTATAMTSASSYAYAYDNFGNPISVSNGTRTTTRSFDALGRLTWEQDNALGTASRVNYAYDAAGRRTRLTWPDNFFVTYDYDNTGALTAIRRAGSSSASDRLAGFGYDDLGRRTSVVRGDNKVTTTYAYNASDLRLQSLTQVPSSASDAVSYSFAYNVAGQITQRTISNPAYVWNGAYAVDRPYGTDGLNRLVDAGASGQSGYTAYGYDGRGNLVCMAAAAPACTNPTTRYFYDVESRLRGTTAGASLAYDPDGRLFSTTTVGNTVTRYLYDGVNVIGEYDNAGTLLRRYVFGGGADEVLARYNGSGTTPEYLLADHQGSIIAATDSNGAVTSKLTYDEYGAPGSSNTGLFQYTGQVYLSDLSLYHYKARVYSPTLGRFLQTDPTGYDDGLNWYAYVGNDPMNRADPTGTECWGNCPADADQIAIGGSLMPGQQFFAVNINSETRGTWGIIGAVASMFIPGGQEVAAGRLAKAAEAVEVGSLRAAGEVQAGKTYQTYTKVNAETGVVYSGKTSGKGTPLQNIARRDAGHHMNQQGFGPAQLDKSSANPQAIRGREQQLIERNGGAQSQGGTSGNKINGISPQNPNGAACRAAAIKEFGPC